MGKITSLMIVLLSVFSVTFASAEPWGRGMRSGFEKANHTESNLNFTQQSDQQQKMRESYVKRRLKY